MEKIIDEYTNIPDANKRYRLRGRAKGRCWTCLNKAEEGFTRCRKCLTENAGYQKKRNKQGGI